MQWEREGRKGSVSKVERAKLDTPVGRLVVDAVPTGVCRVSWVRGPTSDRLGDEGEAAVRGQGAGPSAGLGMLDRAITQLAEYFAGTRRDFDVLVDLDSLTPSTRRVLLALQEVPYGSSITYGELAELSGTGLPARAIGSVMGANPVPILIPCHRVLAGDGLGGYSGGMPGQGLDTKRWLLEHEGVLQPRLL